MNPGVFVMGGGGGGSGGRGGNGSGDGQGGSGSNGGDGADGGGKGAGACGTGSTDGGGCPNHHGSGVPASHSEVPNGKPWAERSALTNLAHRLGPGATEEDVAKRFQEQGYTMETYEGNADDDKRRRRIAANPCPVCKEMLREMGIPHGSIQGHSPKNLTKTGPWNGESTCNPGTRKLFLSAGGRR
ncbi:hypothetical protein [Sorangium sp. So ce1000]|uniref:hypothetical protein n=1 Tax=Sorangium sp. So ce1000 TaxID=3133325 RepID=UPI003F63D5DF